VRQSILPDNGSMVVVTRVMAGGFEVFEFGDFREGIVVCDWNLSGSRSTGSEGRSLFRVA
jgi:hypothetical protein